MATAPDTFNPFAPPTDAQVKANDQALSNIGTNPVGSILGVPTVASLFAGAGPMFYRIGLGAAGVALMIVGLVIMASSSKAGGEVVSGVVKGVGVATPGGVGKAIGKAAVSA